MKIVWVLFPLLLDGKLFLACDWEFGMRPRFSRFSLPTPPPHSSIFHLFSTLLAPQSAVCINWYQSRRSIHLIKNRYKVSFPLHLFLHNFAINTNSYTTRIPNIPGTVDFITSKSPSSSSPSPSTTVVSTFYLHHQASSSSSSLSVSITIHLFVVWCWGTTEGHQLLSPFPLRVQQH